MACESRSFLGGAVVYLVGIIANADSVWPDKFTIHRVAPAPVLPKNRVLHVLGRMVEVFFLNFVFSNGGA